MSILKTKPFENIQKRITLFLICYILMLPVTCLAEKITVTTKPDNAQIYVNGVVKAAGKAVVNVSKKECVVIEIRCEGYITETKNFCNTKGQYTPHNVYVQLQEDESISSSSVSAYVNNDVPVYPKPTKTKEETWKQIVSTVIGKFDVIELNDEKAGYIRTSWVGASYKSNTVRSRLIIKMDSEDPLTYKIKFVSEESGKSGTPYVADEQYHPWNRMLKRYDDFIDELLTKLRN